MNTIQKFYKCTQVNKANTTAVNRGNINDKTITYTYQVRFYFFKKKLEIKSSIFKMGFDMKLFTHN